MHIKTTVRYHYTPEKTTKIYKADQTVLARMSRTWNLQTLLMGMQCSTTTLEKLGSFFKSFIYNIQKLKKNTNVHQQVNG